MSTLELKELSAPAGEVIKIAAGKTLDLKSQGSVTMPTGSVLQVVNVSFSTTTTTTSNVMSDTGLTANITPSSASNDILVFVSLPIRVSSASTNSAMHLQVMRDATIVSYFGRYLAWNGVSTGYVQQTGSVSYKDSPSSTSALTYKIQFRDEINGETVILCHDSSIATLTLMEIQG